MRSLQRVILERVEPASVINTDRRRSYNHLGDFGYAHLRGDHGRDEFGRCEVHITGIEAFWVYAKTLLARFRGTSPKTFPMLLEGMRVPIQQSRQEPHAAHPQNLPRKPLS